ncbi:hypothetical protein CEXT_351661 [Caerostris extrusa]|uniref:Uncharacterized protein n=1 Tax=Caerostris extrusa TaxID=172846 RepID=A0AAV4VA11_CAEEX|nr:hypothetical protein CEXT_351661 [Caerostris extrusa]
MHYLQVDQKLQPPLSLLSYPNPERCRVLLLRCTRSLAHVINCSIVYCSGTWWQTKEKKQNKKQESKSKKKGAVSCPFLGGIQLPGPRRCRPAVILESL